MKPREHIILGGAGSAALLPFWGVSVLWFWAAAVLIDLDHYMDYVYRNGFTDFSIKGMFDYHDVLDELWERPEFLNLSVFHTIEFLGPLYLFSLQDESGILWVVFCGFVFHVALDMIYLYRQNTFFIRAHSIAEYWVRKSRLNRRGLDPASVCAQAVKRVKENA